MSMVDKKTRLSSLEVIKLSLIYFGALSHVKRYFIAMIVAATAFKNYLGFCGHDIRRSLKNQQDANAIRCACIKNSLFNSQWIGMNFLTDFVFEKQLTSYGGHMATKVLKNILFTDSRITNETQGSEFEYYVTEGGKALAKISRFVIFSILAKGAHFIANFCSIIKMDNTEGRMATKIYIVLMVSLTSIKISKLKKIAKFNKLSMDISFSKEKNINETLENIAIIKSSRAEDHAIVKYGRTAYNWEHANITFKFWSFSTDFIYNLCSSTIRPAVSLFFMLNAVPVAVINNSDVLEFMRLLLEMIKTCNNLVNIFSELSKAIEDTYELTQYMDLCKDTIAKKNRVESFNENIQIKDLVYAARDKLIFSGVNFTIQKGDKIALYGKNGSGKSSIFKLILGFDDFKGTILLDGVDISTLNMTEFRDLITYVPQDTKLFDETIFYNLTFGNNRSYKEVIEECKKMKIHDIIMTFPNGYNTDVGEAGKVLNGGLRQKIFYTRAFLRDTEIYMFDEPTNNLDLNHSTFLEEYLNDPKYASKTFFVICHDILMVKKFPKIFHFTDGKITEVDTI